MEPDGEEVKVRVEAGTSILDAARDHDIELEAACEGELACSTCHVILPEDEFNAVSASDRHDGWEARFMVLWLCVRVFFFYVRETVQAEDRPGLGPLLLRYESRLAARECSRSQSPR